MVIYRNCLFPATDDMKKPRLNQDRQAVVDVESREKVAGEKWLERLSRRAIAEGLIFGKKDFKTFSQRDQPL